RGRLVGGPDRRRDRDERQDGERGNHSSILRHHRPFPFQNACSRWALLSVPIPASETARPATAAPMRTIIASVATSPPTATIQPPTISTSARPFIMISSEALCRLRLECRLVFLLDPCAAVGCALLDAAEADERHQQQGEAHHGDQPAEREHAGRPEREAHDEDEEIPSLRRVRPHAFASLRQTSYTAPVPRSPVRM